MSFGVSVGPSSSIWLGESDAVRPLISTETVNALSGAMSDVSPMPSYNVNVDDVSTAVFDPVVLVASAVAAASLFGLVALTTVNSESKSATEDSVEAFVDAEQGQEIAAVSTNGDSSDGYYFPDTDDDRTMLSAAEKEARLALQQGSQPRLLRLVRGLTSQVSKTKTVLEAERAERILEREQAMERMHDLEDEYELGQNKLKETQTQLAQTSVKLEDTQQSLWKTTQHLQKTLTELEDTQQTLETTTENLQALQAERQSLRKLGRVAWQLSKSRISKRLPKRVSRNQEEERKASDAVNAIDHNDGDDKN
jgi:myosin heavy subunit